MRSSLTYYFAGVGTAGIALVIGFGGSLAFFNTVTTKTPLSPTKIERVIRQDQALQAKNNSPAQAVPNIAILEATPAPVPLHIASILQAPKPVDHTGPSESLRPTKNGDNRRADDAQTVGELRSRANVPSSTITVSDQPAPVQDKIAIAKRSRELELRKARDSANHRKRLVAKRKQEIAAATNAVRRMLRDRPELREDELQRPSNMGFSID